MCDGQQASNCDFIPTTEYNSILNDQTVKLEAQFQAIGESLKGRIQVLYCWQYTLVIIWTGQS